jgi:hypothetical protein
MIESFEALSRRTDAESFEPGEPVYRESEPGSVVFLLVEGEVALESDGREVERVKAGELFGEAAAFGEAARHETARAVSAVRVVPIGPALYASLAARDSRFAWSVRASRSRRLKRVAALALVALFCGVALLSGQVWEVDNRLLLPSAVSDGMEFGRVLATGDFDGNGIADLVVGAPKHSSNGVPHRGRIEVFLGTPGGLAGQPVLSLVGLYAEQQLGAALAAGDFNANGRDEIALASPGMDVDQGASVATGAGAVFAIERGTGGDWTSSVEFTQDSAGIQGVAESGDGFGEALSAGDFDGDGYDDLAVGVANEDIGLSENAGAVNVIYGGPGGLTANGSQIWYRTNGITGNVTFGGRLGGALAAGDFDGDGRDDLAIGSPWDLVGEPPVNDGSVTVLYGTVATGLAAAGQSRIDRELLGVLPAGGEHASFGASLAAGDVDPFPACVQAGNCADDLAVGAVVAAAQGAEHAGELFLLYGSASAGGIIFASHLEIDQTIYGGIGATSPEYGDFFGASLAMGPLGPNDRSDLAVGAPLESLGNLTQTGCAFSLLGLYAGYDEVDNAQAQLLSAEPGLASAPMTSFDDFGSALAIGDFNGDGWGDLAIGVAGHLPPGFIKTGAVQVLYGALFSDGFERGDAGHWSD